MLLSNVRSTTCKTWKELFELVQKVLRNIIQDLRF